MAYLHSKWVGFAVVLVAACGDDTTTTDGGADATNDVAQQKDATTDVQADVQTTDAGSDVTSDASADADAAVPLDCNTYCTGITTLCTGGNTQYIDKATCLAVCASIPNDAGTNVTSGNSLACRGHYLALAATDAGGECAHAGAYGFGACGNLCDDFCSLYGKKCDIDAGWGGFAACVTECGNIPGATDPKGPWSDAGADKDNPDMPCREYRLESAYGEGGIPECDTTSQFPSSGCVQL